MWLARLLRVDLRPKWTNAHAVRFLQPGPPMSIGNWQMGTDGVLWREAADGTWERVDVH